MQNDLWSWSASDARAPKRPAAAAILVAVLLLSACTSAKQLPAEATEDPVLEARDELGPPMVALAESVISLSKGLDQARFDVERGDGMRRAVKALAARRKTAAKALEEAASTAGATSAQDAGAIVEGAVADARKALGAADAELRYLKAVSGVDTDLFAAAASWDQPGSQSEIRERLLALAKKVAAIRPQVRRLQPDPAGCAAMKRNRLDWVTTVRTRTLALQAQANSAGGSTFDKLRRSYRALPFAVEPRTADRADRSCWSENSEVNAAADAMRAAVDDLRESLSG